VGWALAVHHPELVERLTILNAPHLKVFGEYLATHRQQQKMSWYMFFFQVPYLAEIRLAQGHFSWIRDIFSTPRFVYSKAEIAERITALQQPGALTGMVNWYRTLFRYYSFSAMFDPTVSAPVKPPTLVIWGNKDFALHSDLAVLSVKMCERGRLEWVDAGHFVQHEQPAKVNALIRDFLESTNP